MTLQSKREVQLTRHKLTRLEELYSKSTAEPTENAHTRELTLRSMRRSIKQLTEEIARFEARTNVPNTEGDSTPPVGCGKLVGNR